MAPTSTRRSWLGSDRLLARVVGQPVARFLAVEASGGILLLAATLIALVWANSPWSESYEDLWTTVLSIEVGDRGITEDLRHWVNDALMSIFFFVVGLEIKRELVDGQFSTPRDAALPAIAALGGMVVPALVYFALNTSGDGADGWGIPMATDIAFALGVLALLGDRVPTSLKVLLLGLAIADDIGAIIIIAVFYTEDLNLGALAVAGVGLAAVALLRRASVWYPPVYVAVGIGVWIAVFESGVHATLAGVALGLMTPARPLMSGIDADRIAAELAQEEEIDAGEVHDIAFRIQNSVSIAQRLEEALHPWTSYVVVPLFALANAGIPLSIDALSDAATSTVTLGVFLGLVVGKLVGVTAATALAVRLGIGRLPEGMGWSHVVGMAGIAGIGFTVSIFITGLAFTDAQLQDEAKIGVLVGSAFAAAVGTVMLLRAKVEPDAGSESGAESGSEARGAAPDRT